jgi:5-methyltetrahydrofolate--homocysteine methyltransferase
MAHRPTADDSPYLDALRRRVLVFDGAMGTSIQRYELTAADFGGERLEGCNDYLVISRPRVIEEIHTAYMEAGCDVLETDTFRSNRITLREYGLENDVREINVAAASLARRVADRFAAADGRKRFVAGSIGPSGFLPSASDPTLGNITFAELVPVFAEQARALAEGGVDVLWIETMSAPEEVEAAVRGAVSAGLPVVTTMSFDTNGRTMMGLTPQAAVAFFATLPTRPAAYGANCGIGPAQLLATLLGFREAASPDDVIVAKGNCGIPEYRDGHIHYSGTPEVMATYARLARDAGARIVGGCCGTQAVHVRAMREALDGADPGPVPDLATVTATLGPVSAPVVQQGEAGQRRRRARA